MAEIIGLSAKIISAALPALISKIKQIAEKKKKTKKFEEVTGKKVILNFSGHPLSQDAEMKLNEMISNSKIINVPIPNVNVQNVVETAAALVEQAANEGAAEHILTGQYLVIPCGLSSLWSILLTIFHALGGHFPRFIYLERKDGAFVPTGLIDLQDVRDQMRTQRF